MAIDRPPRFRLKHSPAGAWDRPKNRWRPIEDEPQEHGTLSKKKTNRCRFIPTLAHKKHGGALLVRSNVGTECQLPTLLGAHTEPSPLPGRAPAGDWTGQSLGETCPFRFVRVPSPTSESCWSEWCRRQVAAFRRAAAAGGFKGGDRRGG